MNQGSNQGGHGQPGKPASPPAGQVGNQPGTKPKDGAVDKANEPGASKGKPSEGSTTSGTK